MLGAIIGDITGSRFEWQNIKSKDFDFLTYRCRPTDDSIMTFAVAQAILSSSGNMNELSRNAIKQMQTLGRKYPDAGYGGRFYNWIFADNPQPYNSWGNGSAMRVSPCAWAADTMDDALAMSDAVTKVTHNHPEGMKGARAVTTAIFMARNGASILEIRDVIHRDYYPMDFTLDQIRADYRFDVSCQGSVPQAIEAFLESTSFEDTIRNAISIGGDSDTIAAIAGSIAESYYGIPADIRNHALTFLDETQLGILNAFECKYGIAVEKESSGGITRPVTFAEKTEVAENNDSRQSAILNAIDTTEKAVKSTQTETEETSASKLFNHLYQACNVLHGHIGHESFKEYIIPLLFLQRISDCYDEETQSALEKYGEDIDLFDEEEIHAFIIPDGCHWADLRRTTEDVGQAIVNAMMGIEHANPDTMAGLYSAFDDASWTDKGKLTDADLKDLIEHLSTVKKGNANYSADIMGDAYEFLIKKFADLSKKNAGEFYTPRSIVKLMVQLLAPKPGETVYDPACGTGGMLIEAIRQMGNAQMAYGNIFGQEKNLSTSAIARMNLFLHGAREFEIRREDTLTHPQFLSGGSIRRFDCVLANPPFGLKNWGAEAFTGDQWGRNIWGCPSDSNADFAWLQHMVCSMKRDTGRCAVVMPQGVLFHGGKEGDIRKQLIESDKLECVITLVGGVFYGAGVSACILFMNNHKPAEHVGKICMIDASTIYTAKRAQNIMTEEDIATVYQLWKDYKNAIDLCAVVDLETIRDKGYTLAVNSYIEKTQAETVSPAQVRKNFFKAVEDVREAEAELKRLLQEGGYLNE